MSSFPSATLTAFNSAEDWVHQASALQLFDALSNNSAQWPLDPQEDLVGALLRKWPSHLPETDEALSKIVKVLHEKGVAIDATNYRRAHMALPSFIRTKDMLNRLQAGQSPEHDPALMLLREALVEGGRGIRKLAKTKAQWMELVEGVPLCQWVLLQADPFNGCGWLDIPRAHGKTSDHDIHNDRATDLRTILKMWSEKGVDDPVALALAAQVQHFFPQELYRPGSKTLAQLQEDNQALFQALTQSSELPDSVGAYEISTPAWKQAHGIRLASHSANKSLTSRQWVELAQSLQTVFPKKTRWTIWAPSVMALGQQAPDPGFWQAQDPTPEGLVRLFAWAYANDNEMRKHNIQRIPCAEFFTQLLQWQAQHRIALTDGQFVKCAKLFAKLYSSDAKTPEEVLQKLVHYQGNTKVQMEALYLQCRALQHAPAPSLPKVRL